MALFLQESIDEGIYFEESISIEEAYEGLIEASMDMQDLTESLLQADFIIHEQCKVLTESEAENKKIGFLTKALMKVKEFISKLTMKIKAFILQIVNYVKSAWEKILTKLNINKQKEVEVPSGFGSLVQNIMDRISKGDKLALDKNANNKEIDENSKGLKDLLGKFNILSKKKEGSKEKLPTSKLLPIIKYLSVGVLAAGVVNSTTLLGNDLKGLEKELVVYKKALENERLDDSKKRDYNEKINGISVKINRINKKGKHGILLTKDIGFFGKVLMLSVLDLVTLKRVVPKINRDDPAENAKERLKRDMEYTKKYDELAAHRQNSNK